MTIKTTQLQTRMWLRSGHNSSNPNNKINNKDPTIEATNLKGNLTTTRIHSKGTGQQLSIKDPTTPEMVNSVSTPKFLITLRKNAEKV
jgi:hypothetical protein